MINFNKTTEYALRIMSHMAQDEKRLYKSDEVYEDLKIPFRYLRRLMTKLSKAGLLVSIQGKYGGFRIKEELQNINLLDIVLAVGEGKKTNECFFGYETCPLTSTCSMHDKWKSVQDEMNKVLQSTTLQDLKKKKPRN